MSGGKSDQVARACRLGGERDGGARVEGEAEGGVIEGGELDVEGARLQLALEHGLLFLAHLGAEDRGSSGVGTGGTERRRRGQWM